MNTSSADQLRVVSDENAFFNNPILNSPYELPTKHWELIDGQPTQKILLMRRPADFVTPIPKVRSKIKETVVEQGSLDFDDTDKLGSDDQQYTKDLINEIRHYVAEWRLKPKTQWRVTPETARLLDYWRNHKFEGIRPFFCQVEAVEVAIWLTEVAPQIPEGKKFIEHLARINEEFNDGVPRLALKLATGAGKTTVMAMLIAWQTINAVKSPKRQKFTKGFLIVAPGITIRDRLRVLQPNDPDSYYANRELVPIDLLPQLQEARVVITNYHAFMLREKIQLSAGTRAALEGRNGEELCTTESNGEMLQRVIPSLMGLERIMVINDEAHHCYREKKTEPSEDYLKGLTGSDKTDAKKDAAENLEAARVWMTGLQAIREHWQSKNGTMLRVFDLSATPFFIAGSGYAQGSMFPWTMSDFSLMDAIECGIVKLPRVPVDDSSPKAKKRLSHIAICGSTSVRTCRRKPEVLRFLILGNSRHCYALRWMHSIRITGKSLISGSKPASKCRPALLLSAITPKPRNSSMTTSVAEMASTVLGSSLCSGTSMTTVILCHVRERF